MFTNKGLGLYLVGIVFSGTMICSAAMWQENRDTSQCPISSCGKAHESDPNRMLSQVLRESGFTGRVEFTLEQRLGRPLDPKLGEVGRLLWFDVTGGLHSDNTCGGCHSPTNGMGDTQSIAIGIQNNNLVGPHRTGPRNQRRTPSASNAAFYPSLM